MKFNAQYIIPIVILVVVVLISLCESCAYFKPYDSEGYDNVHLPLGTSDANYDNEGQIMNDSSSHTMDRALHDGDTGESPNMVATPQGIANNENTNNELLFKNSSNYTSGPVSGEYDTISQAASAPVVRTTFAGRESFATLNDVSGEYEQQEKALDIYSQAKGSSSCEPGPYSNSGGYLCLNDEQNAQLQTRGGNI
uniref:Uncharacterized protein n=1 Tax=viral metagenome TaxID=1070528 RepID=A0A6C0B7Y3_9ZZZZ